MLKKQSLTNDVCRQNAVGQGTAGKGIIVCVRGVILYEYIYIDK